MLFQTGTQLSAVHLGMHYEGCAAVQISGYWQHVPSQAVLGKSQSPLNDLFLCPFPSVKSTPFIATVF